MQFNCVAFYFLIQYVYVVLHPEMHMSTYVIYHKIVRHSKPFFIANSLEYLYFSLQHLHAWRKQGIENVPPSHRSGLRTSWLIICFICSAARLNLTFILWPGWNSILTEYRYSFDQLQCKLFNFGTFHNGRNVWFSLIMFELLLVWPYRQTQVTRVKIQQVTLANISIAPRYRTSDPVKNG